ncbi:hypothetical protein [Paucibacter sp. KCTC 42545]|uniref:hypothetical protein n=1 Tax=Paucibacter sp. KCTC 42545 TaxID=1768242 RepID=UPI000733A52B|nr:hypothetical protein [Paucibacter sp. KCTC 42545]ALT77860.1 hypothetical protein AT984_12365 [Paucibacter sp. KCTC 42545]
MPAKPKPQTPPKPAQPPIYLPAEALKGRGTAWALAHRFSRDEREQFDDGWGTLTQQADEQTLPPRTEIIEERARKILTGNQSPDIPFVLWDGSVH